MRKYPDSKYGERLVAADLRDRHGGVDAIEPPPFRRTADPEGKLIRV